MLEFIKVLWFLYVAHAITDVVGQSDRAIANRRSNWKDHPLASMRYNPHWFYWLLAHGLLNGFGVYMVTDSTILGIGETIHHAFTDYCKDKRWITLGADQLMHFIAKVFWALAVTWR